MEFASANGITHSPERRTKTLRSVHSKSRSRKPPPDVGKSPYLRLDGASRQEKKASFRSRSRMITGCESALLAGLWLFERARRPRTGLNKVQSANQSDQRERFLANARQRGLGAAPRRPGTYVPGSPKFSTSSRRECSQSRRRWAGLSGREVQTSWASFPSRS